MFLLSWRGELVSSCDIPTARSGWLIFQQASTVSTSARTEEILISACFILKAKGLTCHRANTTGLAAASYSAMALVNAGAPASRRSKVENVRRRSRVILLEGWGNAAAAVPLIPALPPLY